MKILYGTTNKAKLKVMQDALKPLGINIISLYDLKKKIPKIEEEGKTPLENAEIKAKLYYDTFKIPVVSCDSGLYFDEVEEIDQPGVYIRRVKGKELTDDEMIEYYSSLARKYGGKLTGQYYNAIYFILNKNHCYSSMDKSIATEPFIISETPHKKRIEGFPLDSLSIDIKSGKYYYDLDSKDVSTSFDKGLEKFFEEVLSKIKKNKFL